ncbi:hypothetical protein ACFL2U_03780 [Patescibacteria group bacterium]
MFESGQTVRLKAKTKHGKDRIHQHGDLWRVAKVGGSVRPFAMLLESLEKTFKLGIEKSHDLRWVDLDGRDPDFEVQLAKN